MNEGSEETRVKSDMLPDFIKVVADKGAADIVVENAETLLDTQLVDGIAKDIPIIGNVYKLGKIGFTIRDYLFLKKLTRFLKELELVSDPERIAFGQRMADDPGTMKSVGEKVLLLLDRLDDLQKPELMGRAFAAYLRGEIDYDQFCRMAAGIDRAIMQDLLLMKSIKNGNTGEIWGMNLASAGLARVAVSAVFGSTHTSYFLTETGQNVLSICIIG